MTKLEREHSKLPPPWDRIFSLGTRTFVWGMFLATLYILRPFFLMVFLTFVFAYIQAHGVEGLSHRIRSRPARVVVVFIVLVATLGGLGYFLAPKIIEQTQIFAERLPDYVENADEEIYQFLEQNPNILGPIGATEPVSGNGPLSTEAVANRSGEELSNQQSGTDPPAQDQVSTRPELVRPFLNQLIGFGTDADQRLDLSKLIDNLSVIATTILSISSAFLLSLLFSFLIVMDLTKLSRGVSELSNTRIGFIYDEVADNIRDFGKVLGRAMEAQIVIALVNTVLTAIGIWLLGLPNVVFLSAIVFFCSFIPVAGVFISSFPICLIALQQENGFSLMLVAVALILIIHAIEAYLLNPQIFGHHLRMNPVLVLIVLVIAGKLFGVWGLILGVPIVNYIFAHAIRLKPDPEPATAET